MRNLLDRRPRLTGLCWIAVGLAVAAQAIAIVRRPPHDRLADLHVYVASGKSLIHGQSLYDFAAANGAPFTYPPFAGMVFLPLTALAEETLRWWWTASTLVLGLGLARWVAREADLAIPERLASVRRVPLIGLVLLVSAPVSSNLRFGQVSLVLAGLVLLDALRVVPNRYRGVVTGLAAAIKLTPMVFIPYWWFSGQRRAAVTATATMTGATLLAWLVLPRESIRFWLTEVWRVERIGRLGSGGNQSLNGALIRWGVADSARSAVAMAVGLAILGLAYWGATRAARAGQYLAAATAVGSAGLVFSPVSWTHHQVWLVLAVFVPVSTRRWATLAWSGLVLAIMVLPVTSVGARLPGAALTGNARLLLAVAVAVIVPFAAARVSARSVADRLAIASVDRELSVVHTDR